MNDQLETWERWPIWAIGLSNGLNIALWYILSMARLEAAELPITVPPFVASWLPLIVVIGGVAAAISLDGALIATIAGARHGRRGVWTWMAMAGAGLFSAAIAYSIHSGDISRAPWLHVAQAVVLILYNLHLMQPRKPLQSDQKPDLHVSSRVNGHSEADPLLGSVSLITDGYRCSKCGSTGFATLADVRSHQRDECLHRQLSASMQPESAVGSHDADGV